MKQKGFTLIELVITIIILGILAVVAAPKFINLGSDARVASLQAIKGSIDSANSMVHAKSQLAGNFKLAEGATGATVDLGNGVTQKIAYGYIPANADDIASALDIKLGKSADEKGVEWYATDATASAQGSPKTISLHQAGSPATCVIKYTQATADAGGVVKPPYFSAMPAAKDC